MAVDDDEGGGHMSGKQSRRSFLRSTALGTAAAAMNPGRAIAAAARKPNLLVILTDEQRPDTMAVYGNTKIKTPNMSRLASESAVFMNAYVTQPVCTPARASIMTGLWPHQSGCMQNDVALPQDRKALPELVDDPDYRTGYFGKWHLGDEIFPQHGFEEWRGMEDGYWKYYHQNRDTKKLSSYAEWLASLGHKPDGTRGEYSRGFVSRLPIEHSKTKYLETQACEFFQRHQKDPFILCLSFLEPHMPFSGPLNDFYKPEDVDLPANFNDPLEDNEPASYRFRSKKYVTGLYANEFDLTKDDEWRRLIANYWGLATQVDRSLGVILDKLETLGLAEDTIVAYTSDHGDMMGSHKLIEKGYMYQEAMKVSWLVRAPRLGRKQQIVEGHASHIDLVPTVLDLMGARTNVTLPGMSRVPEMKGEAQLTDPVFVQWNAPKPLQEGRNPAGALLKEGPALGPNSRAVIMPDGWKLVLHDTDLGQLYNLTNDPGETTNLFDQPEQKSKITDLTNEIRQWQDRIADPILLPA
jgi:arylsulfatase A-like enzyme